MSEKNLSIKLSLNDKQFQSNLKKSMRSLKKFGNSMKRTGQTLSTNFTLPVVALGVAAAKLSSDFEESLNKVNVAFGQSSKVIEDFAKTTLDSFGIAEGSALEMASLFGDMATSMGLSDSMAADMSKTLVGLAGDLASFKNIGIEQSQTALAGIFTGQTESLTNLGVVMTEANLKAFALTQGIDANFKSMSQASKVALRYRYVLEKTKNAQGDFARTSEGVANTTRSIQETFKELGKEVGDIILPITEKLLEITKKVVSAFKNLSDENKELVIKIALLGATLGPILLIFGSLLTSLATIIPLFIKGAAVVGTFVAAMNPLVGIGVAVAGGLTYIASKMGLFTKETKDANNELSKLEDHSLVIAPQQTTPTPTGGGQRRSSIPERIEPIKVLSVELNKVADGFDNATRKAEGLSNVLSNQEQFTLNLTSKFESFGNTIQGVLAQSLQSSEGFFKSFIDGTKQAIKGLMSQIAAMVLMQGILSAFGFGSIGLASESLGKGLGGILGNLPFFANGGLVSGATIGMVGEGRNISMSNPEVIAPLDKLKSMIGTGMGAVEVYGSISGQDILLSSDRARNNRNRTRGY
mgnify:CR=1 FL=1